MRFRFTLAALSAIAGLLLLGTPAFAHPAKPTAPAARLRYQALPRVRPSDKAHWVHAGQRDEGHKTERQRGRGKQVARAEVRSRERVKARREPVRVRSRRAAHAERKAGIAERKAGIATRKTEVSAAKAVVAAPKASLAASDEVANPVPVVSVIRQDGVHPQLEGIEEAATRTAILPDLYDERGRLHVLPALKGSHEILVRQNQMADLDGLTRVADDDDLLRMREAKTLVALPVNSGLRVDDRLAWNRRFCRPWVAQFLQAIGQAHYGAFHRPLQVNSAVRTVSFQMRLMRTNGNAAQADGDAASPHLTGQAIDLAKKGLSSEEIAWMRLYLTRLVEEGRIDVEEEFQQACFHVSIYKRYAPVPPQKIAVTHRTLTPALAALE